MSEYTWGRMNIFTAVERCQDCTLKDLSIWKKFMASVFITEIGFQERL